MADNVCWLFVPALTARCFPLLLGPGGWHALLLACCWFSISSCSTAATCCIANCCWFCRVVSLSLVFWGLGRSGMPGWASLFLGRVLTIDGRQHASWERLSGLLTSTKLWTLSHSRQTNLPQQVLTTSCLYKQLFGGKVVTYSHTYSIPSLLQF